MVSVGLARLFENQGPKLLLHRPSARSAYTCVFQPFRSLKFGFGFRATLDRDWRILHRPKPRLRTRANANLLLGLALSRSLSSGEGIGYAYEYLTEVNERN